MTALLIRTLARPRLSALARPSAVLAFSAAIAYGGGLWLVFMHHIEGGHERNEPSFVLHWLRDSTLALPLICAGVWVGIVLARKLIARAGLSERPLALCAALTAAVVALTATIAVGASSPAHADLFGASHGGHELAFMLHLGRDMLVALVVNLLMSGLVSAALLRGRPWAVPQIDGWFARLNLPRRALINGATALVLIAPLAIVFTSGVARVSASASPGSPCPAGVPVKTFDIQSIDVDIPLNRFGDHDPRGKMFVLSSELDRVRAQERSGRVSIGLRNDAIQPLVIRANIGDCIEIDYRNNASGGEYGIHIDGLAFDARNSGDALGRNPSSAVARGASRSYRFYVPEDATFEGNHYLRPGPGKRDAIDHGLFGALAVEPPGSEYLDMETLEPVRSGWEAIIKPAGRKSFREYVQIYHEIGNESYDLLDASGPRRNASAGTPTATGPAPGRSTTAPSRSTIASTGRDPRSRRTRATAPTCSATRRRASSAPTRATRRNSHPACRRRGLPHLPPARRRHPLAPEPARGLQLLLREDRPGQDPGGRRALKPPGLPGVRPGRVLRPRDRGRRRRRPAGRRRVPLPLPHRRALRVGHVGHVAHVRHQAARPRDAARRQALPAAVTSDELIGRTIGGQTITKANLDDWVRPQLPAQGVRADDQDASVWDWKVDRSSPDAPVYVAEPEDRTNYVNSRTSQDANGLAGHPNLFPGDRLVRLTGETTDRPANAGAGSRTLQFSSAAKLKPGVAIAVSQGKPEIEIRTITSIDANTVTVDKPFNKDHASGHHAGVEFVQSRWYPDVQMDNVFWHDHVDGIRGWAQGLVGQLIVEPKGSTYHDPRTGAEVKSGTIVDIRNDGSDPLAKGQIEGSFRELALWTIDDNQVTDSTLNLTAEPWADRLAKNPDPSLLFSSWTHGDPNTPMPRAYAGDPLAIRSVNVGSSLDTLKIDGHRFFKENRFLNGEGKTQASPTDAIHHGVSERNTLILDGGAGGPQQRAGDYLYFNGIGRRFRQGAWGILRVLPKRLVGDLQPLPGTNVPTGGTQQPSPSGGRPPAPASGGQPCPADATTRRIEVSAIDLVDKRPGVGAVFVPTADAAAVRSGAKPAEPLIVHIAAGECLEVDFTNKRDAGRASFHVSELQKSVESSGVNVGFNPEQTVAVGQSRVVRLHADTRKVGAAMISDFGGNDSGTEGLYGAVVVAPAGATFTDPDSGNLMRFGAGVDVHVPGQSGYRDFTTIFSDDDPIIGGNFMPYPIDVAGPALVNYRTAGNRGDGDGAFSSAANGDPATPLLRAYAGDPTVVHALDAPGSEQGHVIGLGGQSWRIDPEIAKGNETTAQGMGAWEAFDFELIGGAGGRQRESGDYFYGDNRRPFTQQGMWGLMRVLSDPTCPIRPLNGLDCVGQPSVFTGRPPQPNSNPGDAPSGAASSAGSPAASASPTLSASDPPAATPPKVTGSSAPKPRRLRGLKVAQKVDVARLVRNGVRVTVTLDPSARALRLRLLRGAGAKATYSRKLSRGGTVTFTWKPTRAQLRATRAGRYTLEIKAGPSVKRLWRETLKTTIQLTGRLARAR